MADDFENTRQDLFECWTGFDKVRGMEEKRKLRITSRMDLATVFDGSANEFNDPTWLNHISAGGGQYYGNTAVFFLRFDDVPKDKVGPSAPKWDLGHTEGDVTTLEQRDARNHRPRDTIVSL